MTARISPSTKAAGFWSAVLATVFSLAYVVAQLAEWRFVPFDSFLYAVDLLGYSFMSVATLFAARVFTGGGIERVTRWLLTANGLLLPFLALQMYFHPLIWGGTLWAVTFPAST